MNDAENFLQRIYILKYKSMFKWQQEINTLRVKHFKKKICVNNKHLKIMQNHFK